MILKSRFRSMAASFLFFPYLEPTSLLVAGIIDELRKNDGARRRQGPPRPPQVQGRGMPMPDGLLLRRRNIDRIERQSDLDKLAGGFDGMFHQYGSVSTCRMAV